MNASSNTIAQQEQEFVQEIDISQQYQRTVPHLVNEQLLFKAQHEVAICLLSRKTRNKEVMTVDPERPITKDDYERGIE